MKTNWSKFVANGWRAVGSTTPGRCRDRRWWLACVVAAQLTLLANTAWAGNGGKFVLPSAVPAGTPTKCPFSLTLDTDWIDGEGYRPIQVTLVSTPAIPVDRVVSLRLKLTTYVSGMHTMTVNSEVEVPAGSTGVSTIMLAPHSNMISMFALETYVDGEREEKLCVENAGLPSANLGWAPNDMLTMLIVGDGKQDISAIAGLSPSFLQYLSTSTPNGNTNGKPSVTSISQMPTLTGRSVAQLPEQWLEYTSLDTVCITWSDLTLLKSSHPKRWKALRDWVTSGGNLIVLGMGDDWARLPELEATLGLATAKLETTNPTERGWRAPRPANATIAAGFDSAYYSNYGYMANAQTTTTTAEEPESSKPGFYTRDWQFGCVLAMAAADPFPGKTKDWIWVFNEIGHTRRLWQFRHGVNSNGANPEFWNFLITGVGLPPVGAFRILITLFVIVIGPVNYWVLMRWRRLHLLLFTVPASALVVTLALFCYGIASDGFGARVRTRSYTQIDQPNSQAVCWSRQSYYAAVAPSQGLIVPRDVAVYPFESASDSSLIQQSHEVGWDERQKLTRGWLNSRTITQFVMVRSRTSAAALKFTPVGAGNELRVENNLGVHVQQLLVSNDLGKWSFAQQLAPSATASLIPLTEEIMSSNDSPLARFNKAITEARPQTPSDFTQFSNNNGNIFGIRRRTYWQNGNQSVVSQGSSRMEVSFERAGKTLAAIRDKSASGPSASEATPPGVLKPEVIAPLGPRSYLAWVDRSPEFVTGLESPQEVESFHLIEGHW